MWLPDVDFLFLHAVYSLTKNCIYRSLTTTEANIYVDGLMEVFEYLLD